MPDNPLMAHFPGRCSRQPGLYRQAGKEQPVALCTPLALEDPLSGSAPVGFKGCLQPGGKLSILCVLDDVLANQFPDDLGSRDILAGANLFEDFLLEGVYEDGKAGGTVFHS
jgi:hypothetical protein